MKELVLMSHLDVMISMDSANMHLASLVATPVVSVWGATHPYAGFMGWGQSEDNAVQVDLPCRPCSIYGNKVCRRGGSYKHSDSYRHTGREYQGESFLPAEGGRL